MAQILVRDLEVQTVERLKSRARRGGRSLQTEVKAILEQAAVLDAESARELARRLRRRHRGRRFDDAAELIRAERDR